MDADCDMNETFPTTCSQRQIYRTDPLTNPERS